jgi:hypothetical protein
LYQRGAWLSSPRRRSSRWSRYERRRRDERAPFLDDRGSRDD